MAYLSEVTLADFQRRHPKLATAAAMVASVVRRRATNVHGAPLYSERLLVIAAEVTAAEDAIQRAGEAVRSHPQFRRDQYRQALSGVGLLLKTPGRPAPAAGPAKEHA